MHVHQPPVVKLAVLIVPVVAVLAALWLVVQPPSFGMSSSAPAQKPVEERELLPANVTPTHYEILLAPDLEALTYSGKVSINVRIHESTKEVVLHSNELELSKATLAVGDAAPQPASRIDLRKEDETAHLHFAQQLEAGSEATLVIEFRGVLNDLMVGFYRSRYTDAQGTDKFMATTQFEPTDARRAFPCWDEPTQKATFDVTLRVDEALTALSNMDVASETPAGDGLKDVRFNRTPVMSTYLLAFVVGELEFIEAHTSGKHNGRPIPCRVYTTPGKSARGKFALDVAVQVLEYFADVFGIAYALPKLDQIAINDFESGAMENWGLITYREVALLVDEASSSSQARQQVAYVVSHELAHQWFGNLVTMEWWSELWLNEGFATWVGTLAVDHVFPEYHIWTQFLVDDLNRALALDALRSSHPIQVPVRRSADISQIFDAISYSKGGSAIRMLSSYIGLDSFLAGVRAYLQKHKYANASTQDLWSALSDASGVNVTEFMAIWTRTVGYPVLTVQELPGGAQIKVQQDRYLSAGHASDDENQTLWWVPLRIKAAGAEACNSSAVLTARSAVFDVPAAEAKWYKLNHDTVGICRVKYSPSAVASLAAAIAKGELGINDRIGIISDAAALATSGHSSTVDFLTLLRAYSNETEFVVWQEISQRLDALQSVWANEAEAIGRIRALARTLYSPLAKRLGWDAVSGEDSLASRLRALAIRAAGFSGDAHVAAEARRRVNAFFEGDRSVFNSDTQRAAFAVAVRTGGRAEFDKIRGYYLDTANPVDQRLAALSSLGFATDAALVDDVLTFALSERVRNQDLHQAIAAINTSGSNRQRLWQWYCDNYAVLAARYRASMNYMGILLRLSVAEFTGNSRADEIEAFFAARDTSKFRRVLDQSLEKIRANTRWLEKDRSDVAAWLQSNNY